MNSVKDDENSLLVTIVLLRASLNDQKTRSNQLRKCELMGSTDWMWGGGRGRGNGLGVSWRMEMLEPT